MASKNPSRKLKVGVLRGGPSSEYEVSLKSGQHILDSLRGRKNYEVQDIYIDRSGAWHIDGVVRPVERIFPHIDVAVNAMHGAYGEDGRVQQLLEAHGIPFTGSGSLGSALAMNKPLAKKFFRERGLLTPEHLVVKKQEYTTDLLQKILFSYPHLRLVKPAASGSSLGVRVANSDQEFDEAIRNAFDYSDSVLIEEFIKGKQATCGVVEGSEYETHALHPVEVRNLTEIICPGDFTPEQTQLIQQAALDAHRALGLRQYSDSDFIVNRNGVYILETNSLPGMTTTSLFPKALSTAGITIGEFLDHLIGLATHMS